MRLLVIDDSRLDRKMIKRLINQEEIDASIIEADGIDAALGMVASGHFDCILIDYHIPGSNGVSLASRIMTCLKEAPPIVMLTAEPSPELAEQALSSGLADFMSKQGLTSKQLHRSLSNALIN